MTTAAEQLEMEEDLFGDTADSPLEIARVQLAICARKLVAAEKKIRRLQGRVSKREDSIQKEIAKRKKAKNGQQECGCCIAGEAHVSRKCAYCREWTLVRRVLCHV